MTGKIEILENVNKKFGQKYCSKTYFSLFDNFPLYLNIDDAIQQILPVLLIKNWCLAFSHFEHKQNYCLPNFLQYFSNFCDFRSTLRYERSSSWGLPNPKNSVKSEWLDRFGQFKKHFVAFSKKITFTV